MRPSDAKGRAMNIVEVEGIGATYAATLAAAGITTTEDYLAAAASPADRQALVARTGIDPWLILEWANHVDLMRIDGVGSEYADLLEAAGVDTVVELSQRNPANLADTLAEVNGLKDLVRRLPGPDTVADWVAEAKTLPRILTY